MTAVIALKYLCDSLMEEVRLVLETTNKKGEGMPKQIIVNELIKGIVSKPSLAWWLEYLEDFRQRLKPELSRFTLPCIGDKGDLRKGQYSCRHLSEFKPKLIADDQFSLETQGIFSGNILSPSIPHKKSDGVKMFWGLTRSAKWVKVEYYFVVEGKDEVLTEVYIKEVTLENLFKTKLFLATITPVHVWNLLFNNFREWHKKREELFLQSKDLFDEVCLVDQLCVGVPR